MKRNVLCILIIVIFIIIFSQYPVLAHHSGTNPPYQTDEPLKKYFIYVKSGNECTKTDQYENTFLKAVSTDYLHMYGFNYITTNGGECIEVKGTVQYDRDDDTYGLEIEEALERAQEFDYDLLILLFDNEFSRQYFESTYKKDDYTYWVGHYRHDGDFRQIVSTTTVQELDKEPTAIWTLSHELAHFALEFLDYPPEIHSGYVHEIQKKYNECLANNFRFAYCSDTYLTLIDWGGKYKVLKPYDKPIPKPTNPNLNDIDRLTVKELKIYSPYDVDSNKFLPGNDIAFEVVVFNNHAKKQSVAVIQQIQDSNGKTVKNSWITISINSRELVQPQFYWTPKTSGTYTTTFFFWESVDDSTAVAYPTTASFQVYDKPKQENAVPNQEYDNQNQKDDEPKQENPIYMPDPQNRIDKFDSQQRKILNRVNSLNAKWILVNDTISHAKFQNPKAQEKLEQAKMILHLKSKDFPVSYSIGSTLSREALLNLENFEERLNNLEKVPDLILGHYNEAERLEFGTKSTQIIKKDKTVLPSWIKNNAKWWSEGSIDDSDFINGIQHMIQEKIIDIPNMPEQRYITQDKVPKWIKNQAEWWAKGLISEDEFLASIEYLVSNGIIQTK